MSFLQGFLLETFTSDYFTLMLRLCEKEERWKTESHVILSKELGILTQKMTNSSEKVDSTKSFSLEKLVLNGDFPTIDE